MDKKEKKINKIVEDLTMDSIVNLLERWDMAEFVDFVKDKQLDGRKLMNVTEGIVKLWRPKSNANKLILFVQDLKMNPEKVLDNSKKYFNETLSLNKDICDKEGNNEDICSNNPVDEELSIILKEDFESKVSVQAIESQYQTVKKTKINNLAAFNNVEELIKKIVPAKTFLYRNQEKKETTPSYLPMDGGTPKKRKNMFRVSGYDYPKLDIRRFSKQDLGDRGYYPMKRNSRFFIQKSKHPESETRPKYKSISSTEELKYPEDHFYEDLCYNEVENETKRCNSIPPQNAKSYRVLIQELFQSFKMPFFKRTEEVIQEDKRIQVEEKEANFYENSDGIANMYDSVHVNAQLEETDKTTVKAKLPVEEYLEPVLLNKDYCDISYQSQKAKDESLLGYIMSIFENKFGTKRVSVPLMYNLGRRVNEHVVDIFYRLMHCLSDAGVVAETNDCENSEDSEDEKTTEAEARRWSEDQKQKTNMADRPLPVPVENEPYYMDIDRTEAENLLKAQLDGTFVLRPSSQPNHAYTLSVSCNNAVHNVPVRRRTDGRLALGFARRGERSFADVTSLLRHHRKRRLLLVANGSVIGATTLNESPQYYQTPCNIPVKVHL